MKLRRVHVFTGVALVAMSAGSILVEAAQLWTKDGASARDFLRDHYECKRDMLQALGPPQYQNPIVVPGRGARGVAGAVLGGLGASLSDISEEMARSRFVSECLQARGWSLE